MGKEVAIGDCRLILGDCLTVLPTLAAGSVQAIVADPPYGIDYQSARRTDRSQWKPKVANDTRPFVWWMHAARRVCADNGCCLCFCRWDVQEAFRLAMDWAGFEVKAQLIWDREAHGMGDLNGSPAPQHDVLWFGRAESFAFHGLRPVSVIRSQRLGGEALDHPNQKPVDLMVSLIESYAPPHETVLSPFLGSGTDGVAAILAGRKFIGIESDPNYFEIACSRVQKAFDEERTSLLTTAAKEEQRQLFTE